MNVPNEFGINPTNVRPIGDRVLVKHSPRAKTYGSIIIPDKFQKKTHEGTVIAVGTRLHDAPEAGDVVTWETFAGQELGKDETGDAYLVLRESEILAVIG